MCICIWSVCSSNHFELSINPELTSQSFVTVIVISGTIINIYYHRFTIVIDGTRLNLWQRKECLHAYEAATVGSSHCASYIPFMCVSRSMRSAHVYEWVIHKKGQSYPEFHIKLCSIASSPNIPSYPVRQQSQT